MLPIGAHFGKDSIELPTFGVVQRVQSQLVAAQPVPSYRKNEPGSYLGSPFRSTFQCYYEPLALLATVARLSLHRQPQECRQQ